MCVLFVWICVCVCMCTYMCRGRGITRPSLCGWHTSLRRAVGDVCRVNCVVRRAPLALAARHAWRMAGAGGWGRGGGGGVGSEPRRKKEEKK